MTGRDSERRRRGLEILHQMGDEETVTGFLGALSSVAPDLGDYIVDFVCGDLLRRPGLSTREKELVTLAALAVQGGAEGMLGVHVKAALYMGIEPEAVIGVLIHMAAYGGFPRAVAAVTVAGRVFADNPALMGGGGPRSSGSAA